MIQDAALPMKSIYDPRGELYLSVIDAGETVRIQLHRYDLTFKHPLFLTIDKRSLTELIQALESMEDW